jgi:hypothetical protein
MNNVPSWITIGLCLAILSAVSAAAQEAVPAAAGPEVDAWLAGLNAAEQDKRIEAAKAVTKWFDSFREKRRGAAGFSDLPVQPAAERARTPAPRLAPDPAIVDRLIAALEPLLVEAGETVVDASARALGSVPVKTAKVEQALVRAVSLRNSDVDRWVLNAVKRWKPDARQMVPLLAARIGEEKQSPWAYGWTLSEYGEEARAAVPALLAMLNREEDDVRQAAANGLFEIGVDEATARRLEAGEIRVHPTLGGNVFLILLKHPGLAAKYIRARPELGKDVSKRQQLIAESLNGSAAGVAKLRAALLEVKGLSPTMMAVLGDERFLPELEAQIKTADPHHRSLLEACARACGKRAETVAKLSKDQPEGPKPKSAWPDTDARRKSKSSSGHGDGYAPIVVTGRLLMADGTPANSPAFYATNDRMLLGQAEKTREPVRYDPKTGRFVYVTSVFAAYEMGNGQPEPGPYQTGSAQTLIEAEGAESLVVRFFDEMPEVEVGLTRKQAGVNPE